jgi:HK97 family phage portal protein
MNLIQRAFQSVTKAVLSPVYATNGFSSWLWGAVRDWYPGAWQNNDELTTDNILSFATVYACISLIAQDIGKMRPKLVQKQDSGIWKEVEAAAFSPVLRKPNHFQTRIKFLEYWVASKLIHGNAYALKQRDGRGNVVKMYLLDPQRVTPLVSDNGEVFYQLRTDQLSGLEADVLVPAREIIHDIEIALFHPLIGVSPIFACGLAATQGIRIQNNSQKFFANMSRPSGILTAPGPIADATAATLKARWEANFGGANIGKVAVLGDGLHYEPMTITPVDAQLIEQLKMSAETVCSCFHVPPYMVGVGAMPPYNNIEALNMQYYSQALQNKIESIELLLDEGLGLVDTDAGYGVELDLDALLRMDSATRFDTWSKAIGGGWFAPNEARKKEDLPPVEGGDSPMIQQQNYSLAALAKRDAQADPFATAQPIAPEPDEPDEPEDDDEVSEDAKMLADMIIRGLSESTHVTG